LDSFPADLSYCLRLLIGFDAVEVDHGGRLSAMGCMWSPMNQWPMAALACDPVSQACR